MVDLSGEEARHLARVLRLASGAMVEAFDGQGRWARGRIRRISTSKLTVELAAVYEDPPSRWHGTLIQGALKGDKKDEIVRAAVELGVHRIVFFAAERSIGRPDAADCRRWAARWRATAIAAAKQCGRNRLPEVFWIPELDAALMASKDVDGSLLCDTAADATHWGAIRDRLLSGSSRRSVRAAVGPEGGWVEREVDQFCAAGFLPLRVGPHILRAETAAIAVMALLAAEFEPPE